MSGYIGKGRSVVNVASYTKAQADAEFVNDPNSVITVSSGKLLVGTTSDYAENVQAAFYGASNGGISLASGTTGLSRLMFADGVAGTAGAYVGSIIYSHADDSLRFNVNGGTERMRLDSSGRLLVGQSRTTQPGVVNTTTGFGIRNNGLFFASAYQGRTGTLSRSGSDGDVLGFYRAGARAGSIGVTTNLMTIMGKDGDGGLAIQNNSFGDIVYPASNSSGGASDNAIDLGYSSGRFKDAYFGGTVNAANFNTTSDATLKTNVETLTGSLDAVTSLRGVSFDWLENGGSEIGVIAQEVEAVLPDVVSTNDEGIKSVKYGNMVAVLIEAIKEQQLRIEALEAKLGE